MDVSYWPELGAQHHLGRETAAFHQAEYAGDLILCFCNDCTSNASPTLLDVFCEPVQDDQVFDVDNGIDSGNLLPCSPAPITQPEYITPSNGVECYGTYPKRIKTTSGTFSCSYDRGDHMLTENPCYGVDEFLPALQQFPVDNFQGTLPEWPEKPPMSTQTVAARLRRKKISDKTLELGRLVPGGSKMNTADMYLAAFKYVKLMEAQIGILKLMVSIRECKNPGEVEGLRALLSSSKLQERMYEEGKCLVTKELVQILAKEQQILSSPSVSKELNSLLC